MPEGDSVLRVARRLDAGISGLTVRHSDFRVPQHATVQLAGRPVNSTVARGKHLLTRVDGGITLHTHLRMDGEWTVLPPGRGLPSRLRPDVRVELSTAGADGAPGPTAVALRMPVVDVLRTEDEGDVVGHLGPDVLGTDWDVDHARQRLLGDPGRPVNAALLDQRNLAGLGNLWVNELCFLRGLDPCTPVGEVDLRPLLDLARRMLTFSVSATGAAQVTTGDTRRGRRHWVSGRAGLPCLRCGTTVLVRAEVPGDAERRRTWWCPHCQPPPGRQREPTTDRTADRTADRTTDRTADRTADRTDGPTRGAAPR